jgi:Cu/Ag efflux protein CusF
MGYNLILASRLVETMRKLLLLSLAIGLMAATAAHAQYGGGMGGGGGTMGGGGSGGGGGGGHRHGGGGAPPSGGGSSSGPRAPAEKLTPVSEDDIIGVVQAVDSANGRITIAYEPVAVRNWPAGVMPFAVAKPELLDGATVGEKVRFKLDSQQIVELDPYSGAPRPAP